MNPTPKYLADRQVDTRSNSSGRGQSLGYFVLREGDPDGNIIYDRFDQGGTFKGAVRGVPQNADAIDQATWEQTFAFNKAAQGNNQGARDGGQSEGIKSETINGGVYEIGSKAHTQALASNQAPQPTQNTQQNTQTATVAQPQQSGQGYTVQAGDTINAIAAKMGVAPSAITGYRSGNPNLIYPGEVLSVGGGTQQAPNASVSPQNGLGTQGTPDTSNIMAGLQNVSQSLQGLVDKGYGNTDLSALPQDTDISQLPPAGQTQTQAQNPTDDLFAQFGIKTNGIQNTKIEDVVKQISKAYGMDDINDEMEDLDDNYADEVMEIDQNPWLSEGLRSKKTALLKEKYDSKRSALVDRLRLQQDVVGQAIDVYYKEKDLQQEQLKMALEQRNNELDRQADLLTTSPSDIYGTGAIGEYNFAVSQGYQGSFTQYQNEDANRKATASGGGLFSAAQINSTVNQIAGAFDNEPLVKNFNMVKSGYQFAQSLSNTTQNPADDQALIYAYAKVMDPESVVREGEYNTVQKYSQSWVQSFGKSVTQAINGTGFLSTEARTNIKKTIASKYKVTEENYKSLYNQYQSRLDTARSGQGNTLTDYSAGNTVQDTQNPPIIDWMEDYNYTRDIQQAREAIAQGADRNAVETRLRAKYKDVNL